MATKKPVKKTATKKPATKGSGVVSVTGRAVRSEQ